MATLAFATQIQGVATRWPPVGRATKSKGGNQAATLAFWPCSIALALTNLCLTCAEKIQPIPRVHSIRVAGNHRYPGAPHSPLESTSSWFRNIPHADK